MYLFYKYQSDDDGGNHTLNNEKEALEESNQLIVENEKFKKYLKLKEKILIKRRFFAICHTLLILAMIVLYYLDIGKDINLIYDYFNSSKINFYNEALQNSTDKLNEPLEVNFNFIFGVITLFLFIVSSILHYKLVFALNQTELKFKLNIKQKNAFIIKIFRILLYQEMLIRYVKLSLNENIMLISNIIISKFFSKNTINLE